ncbi:hypothetical protein JKA74_09345 [Marivirga sp. S37H4]|uniref:Peptidase C80 domain-containing protein n=1 Tax=Marivirga aurantiaca TaxID=2802615 RepID=A0A935CB92_9BACT|nr:hypothetical protein [Marivirga aurantiaca]MBK6265243.1 hypothetical protein [Marivirga aurantiaca]
MNTYADKTKENKSQSVSAVNSQIQSSSESTFQFVDNRPEAAQLRKLQTLMKPNIENNSSRVTQLTRMLQVQKIPDEEDKKLFKQGLKKFGATQIVNYTKRDPTIKDDETIILVAHGNTNEVGDEEDQEGSLSYKPDEIARMLNTIVPDTWHGEFILRSCDAAVTPVGGSSFLQRVRESFLQLRPHHQGVMSGPAGTIDYKMTQNAKVLMERFKGDEEDSRDVPYKSAMVKFHPGGASSFPGNHVDDDWTNTMSSNELRAWWNRAKSGEGVRVQPDHMK